MSSVKLAGNPVQPSVVLVSALRSGLLRVLLLALYYASPQAMSSSEDTSMAIGSLPYSRLAKLVAITCLAPLYPSYPNMSFGLVRACVGMSVRAGRDMRAMS